MVAFGQEETDHSWVTLRAAMALSILLVFDDMH